MDVDQLKQLIQQYFVGPLGNLPITQIKFLETNHDQSVQDFQNALGALFAPHGPSFQGQAANAIAEYIGKYLDAEEALSPYAGNGFSERITTLLNKCAAALLHEETSLKALDSNAGWAAAGATLATGEVIAAPEEGAAPPTIPVVQILILIGAAVAFVWASADQQNKINDLTGTMNQWVSDMQTLAQQPDPPGSQLPGLPSQISTAITYDTEQIVASSVKITLTPEQEKLVKTLADEYGLSVEEVAELLALDPTATEAELRKKIERYLQLSKRYPELAKNNPQWLLWAAAFNLSDKAVAFLANLNDGKTSTYLKGKPLEEAATDILAAVLSELTREASEQLRDLVKRAKAAKAAGTPLDEAIPEWDDLPPEVQQLLDWKGGSTTYAYQYGKAIESLVKEKFASQYGDMQSFYENNLGMKFNKALLGDGKLLPDVQITVDGHTDVLDITSLKNAPTKVKYDVSGVQILIVITYGG